MLVELQGDAINIDFISAIGPIKSDVEGHISHKFSINIQGHKELVISLRAECFVTRDPTIESSQWFVVFKDYNKMKNSISYVNTLRKITNLRNRLLKICNNDQQLIKLEL